MDLVSSTHHILPVSIREDVFLQPIERKPALALVNKRAECFLGFKAILELGK